MGGIEEAARADPDLRSRGGYARADSLSPERRQDIAAQAASARWSKALKRIPSLDLGPGTGRKADAIGLPGAFVSRFGDLKTLRWFEVEGDSMFPSLRHGDIAIVALRDTPRDGAVHVVAVNHGASLRRVRARPDGGWISSCDNPVVTVEESSARIAVVGVVVCRLGSP